MINICSCTSSNFRIIVKFFLKRFFPGSRKLNEMFDKTMRSKRELLNN